MRDFLEYVEKNKEDSPNSLDFYMEGFSADLLKMEGMDPIKAFILGFIAGKGIDISQNKDQLIKLLEKNKIQSTSQAISNLKTSDEGSDLKDLRTSLAKALTSFRTIFKNKKEEEMM
jgi:hypothetical protein